MGELIHPLLLYESHDDVRSGISNGEKASNEGYTYVYIYVYVYIYIRTDTYVYVRIDIIYSDVEMLRGRWWWTAAEAQAT